MKSDYRRVLPEEWSAMSKVFTALGDEHRQRILLLFEPGERLNVGQIAEVSTLARSTVSHHLKVLADAGLIACGSQAYLSPRLHRSVAALEVLA